MLVTGVVMVVAMVLMEVMVVVVMVKDTHHIKQIKVKKNIPLRAHVGLKRLKNNIFYYGSGGTGNGHPSYQKIFTEDVRKLIGQLGRVLHALACWQCLDMCTA